MISLSVDRSRWEDLPIPLNWSPAALERKEPKRAAYRATVEEDERFAARRAFFGPRPWRLIDWLWKLAIPEAILCDTPKIILSGAKKTLDSAEK